MVEFEHVINNSEYLHNYIDLTDDQGKRYGTQIGSQDTILTVLDGEGRKTTMKRHCGHQLTECGEWFSDNRINPHARILVRFVSSLILEGKPVLYLVPLNKGSGGTDTISDPNSTGEAESRRDADSLPTIKTNPVIDHLIDEYHPDTTGIHADSMEIRTDSTKSTNPEPAKIRLESEMGVERLPQDTAQLDRIVGNSAAMLQVCSLARRIADSRASVLITGECGTGKAAIAHYIHKQSSRGQKAFASFNCGGLPSDMIESELFGYEKGAFTGAVAPQLGLIERVNGGTFLFDEIADLPPNLHLKLLRTMQRRRIRRVGGNKEIDLDVRLISTTSRDLEAMVQEGTFRGDLYYYAKAILVHLPSLQERPDDIVPLVHLFLENYANATGKEIRGFTPEAMELLCRYSWPGNVLELRHMIEGAVALASSGQIQAVDLPGVPQGDYSQEIDDQRFGLPFKEAKEAVVEEFELAYIRGLLRTHRGNISQAAKQSGIDRRSLHRLLTKHRLDASEYSQ